MRVSRLAAVVVLFVVGAISLFSLSAFAACPQIRVGPVSLPNGTTGTSYVQTVTESGTPSATFSITSGGLPPGLGLANPTATSIDVTGTPTQLGTFTFTLTATDVNGCTGGRTYKITIACGTITVSPANLPNGQTGTPYGQSVSAAGGTAPYTYAVTAGALPTGLTLDTNTGAIQNAPTVAGSYSFTITATDANLCTGSQAYSNVLVCDPPAITPTPATICANSTGNVAAGPAGGTTYAWSIVNGTITSATNTQNITYTAGASGTTDLTLTVTNAAGCSASNTVNVPVAAKPTLGPAGGTLNALYHAGFSQMFTAAGGTAPYTFTISPVTPPAGLSFTTGATTATLSGSAPTLPNTTTNGAMFTVTVTDANNCSASQTYTLVIRPNTVADAYMGGVGNTQYVVTGYTPAPTTPAVSSATNVLTNDVYPGAATLAVTTPPTHGAVSLLNTGQFLYTPNVGDVAASDSFVYTLTDANGVTNTATVTIGLTGMVWYVNNTIGSSGDGRSHNPFKLLSDAQGPALMKPQTGQIIYVHTGSGNTTGNLNLLANQMLIGNGVALSVGGLSLAAGAKPTVTGAVALGNDTTVKGIAFVPTGSAITSSGITGTTTVDQNTITATSGVAAVSLQTGAGTINFTNTPISKTAGAGTGLVVNGKTGGAVTFDAASPIGVTAGGATGINLTNNNVTTLSFAGTLTLSTTTAPAFIATGPGPGATTGGTVTVSGTGNVVTTSTGTAVNIANTTIGGAGVTFQKVSSTGAASGIILNNTGAGSFTITGNGALNCKTTAANCDGGAIQTSTAPGMTFTSTGAVSLTNVNVTGGGDDGIRGNGVGAFTLVTSRVTSNGNATTERGIELTNVGGSGAITNCTVTGNAEDNLWIQNNNTNLTAFNITGSTFSNTSTSVGNDGVHVEGLGNSNMTFSVTGSTFDHNRGDHFQVTTDAVSAATMNATFSGNTLTGDRGASYGGTDLGDSITINPGGSAILNVTLSTNNITGAVSSAITLNSSNSSQIHATVSGNIIGAAGTVDSGSSQGDGINITAINTSQTHALVQNNQIRQYSNLAGINVTQSSGSAFVEATLTGNTIANPGTFAAQGIFVSAGAASGDSGTMCMDIGGAGALANSFAGVGAGGTTDFRIRQRMSTTVRLPGYGGGATNTGAVIAYISGRNTGAPSGAADTNSPPGGGFIGGAACVAP